MIYIEEIQEEKAKDLTIKNKVIPNFIYNRFDIMYNEYKLFYVHDGIYKYYIPVKIKNSIAILGLQLVDIEKNIGKYFIQYLLKKYNLRKVKFKFCLSKLDNVACQQYCYLNLSDNINDFMKNLSSDTRYNIGRYTRKIEKNFKMEIKHYDKLGIIDNKIYDSYSFFKKNTHGYCGNNEAEEYLSEKFVTDAYVMYLDDVIASIVFINKLDSSAYLENLTYDTKYKNYSIGTILYFNVIKKLIESKIKTFYLYDGTLEYKKRFNGTVVDTYTGTTYRYRPINFIIHLIMNLFKKNF